MKDFFFRGFEGAYFCMKKKKSSFKGGGHHFILEHPETAIEYINRALRKIDEQEQYFVKIIEPLYLKVMFPKLNL